MTDLVQRPEDELIDALTFLSDEARISTTWFVLGGSIEDDLDIVFSYPHIQWPEIAPNSMNCESYQKLHDIYEIITGDEFRKKEYNNHLSIDLIEKSNIWKKIPPLAKTLKATLEFEISNRKQPI